MRFEDLSPEDQRLLQTDLGEFDKVAAEQVALIDEMYTTGFNKLAYETADWLDKLAEEEAEKEEEDKMDEEGEKTAAALGAWTERGFFDGLRKLGSDRYGDELHYLYPFLEEKIAAEGEEGWIKKKLKAGKDYLTDYGTNTANEFREMVAKGKTFGQRAGHAGKAALRVGGPLAVVGGAAYGGKKLYDRRKKSQQPQNEKKAADKNSTHKSYSFSVGSRARDSERDIKRRKLMEEIARREISDEMQMPSRPIARMAGGLAGAGVGANALGLLAAALDGGRKTQIAAQIAGLGAGGYGGQALGKFLGDRAAKRNRLTADHKKEILKNI